MLHKGGFELSKWSSNNQAILNAIPHSQRGILQPIAICGDEAIKTLGLTWVPGPDVFKFKVNLSTLGNTLTKRIILADIARLYDPLGWLAPTIIIAKIMIQRMWILQLGWDEHVPDLIHKEWMAYRSELQQLEDVHITRWLKYTTRSEISLHAFCDASEAAYGAVVYARCVQPDGSMTVELVSAKTKVSPIKQISLPRLELCGAVLLVRLLNSLNTIMNFEAVSCYAWTDSQIVLSWIQKLPNNWKTFVANRVSEIQSSPLQITWKHVLWLCIGTFPQHYYFQ